MRHMQHVAIFIVALITSGCGANNVQNEDVLNIVASSVSSSSTSSRSSSYDSARLSIYDASRITKKEFGQYVSANNSPIEDERFTGFHTGVDFEAFEYEDETSITVPALCTGPLRYTGRISGYGGVALQTCKYDNKDITVLYGHLDPSSLDVHSANTVLKKGETVGNLGLGFSNQTDNERAHLHLAAYYGTHNEYRGYVRTEAQVDNWIDPMVLVEQF